MYCPKVSSGYQRASETKNMAMSDFASGQGFAQAQVHTFNSTNAEDTSAIDSMHECLSKTLSQESPHGEIAFSISRD